MKTLEFEISELAVNDEWETHNEDDFFAEILNKKDLLSISDLLKNNDITLSVETSNAECFMRTNMITDAKSNATPEQESYLNSYEDLVYDTDASFYSYASYKPEKDSFELRLVMESHDCGWVDKPVPLNAEEQAGLNNECKTYIRDFMSRILDKSKEEQEHKKDEIISYLQCYINLTQFDANTGEDRVCLSPEERNCCTACEETIKILCGASEKDLSMPREQIIANLKSIRDWFQSCYDEGAKHPDYKPTELNIGTLNAVKAALSIVEKNEKQNQAEYSI